MGGDAVSLILYFKYLLKACARDREILWAESRSRNSKISAIESIKLFQILLAKLISEIMDTIETLEGNVG